MISGAAWATPSAASEADRDLRDELQAFIDRLHLVDVRVQRLSAETMAEPPLAVEAVVINTASPEILLESNQFAVRFTQHVQLQGPGQEALVQVEIALIVDHRLDEGPTPSPEAVQAYVDHNAYFIAHPYLRETLQSATLRLGLNPVVMGILPRGESRPSELTVVSVSVLPTTS